MKRKTTVVLIALLSALGLCLGLAGCGGRKQPQQQEDPVVVGQSAKALLDRKFTAVDGYMGTMGSQSIPYTVKGSYTSGEFDYTYTGKSPNGTAEESYYLRSGKWFGSNDEEGFIYAPSATSLFEPLYSDDTHAEMFIRPDGEIAALGNALILTLIENGKIKSGNYGNYDAETYTGTFTGEEQIAVPFLNFAKGQWEGTETDAPFTVTQAIHDMEFFRWAAAPFTQEQLVKLLNAIAGTDTKIAPYCARILQNGKTVSGQSAYDYLMGAFDEMYKDVTEPYLDYAEKAFREALGDHWLDADDMEPGTAINTGAEEMVLDLYDAILTLTMGLDMSWTRSGLSAYYEFDDDGALTAIFFRDGEEDKGRFTFPASAETEDLGGRATKAVLAVYPQEGEYSSEGVTVIMKNGEIADITSLLGQPVTVKKENGKIVGVRFESAPGGMLTETDYDVRVDFVKSYYDLIARYEIILQYVKFSDDPDILPEADAVPFQLTPSSYIYCDGAFETFLDGSYEQHGVLPYQQFGSIRDRSNLLYYADKATFGATVTEGGKEPQRYLYNYANEERVLIYAEDDGTVYCHENGADWAYFYEKDSMRKREVEHAAFMDEPFRFFFSVWELPSAEYYAFFSYADGKFSFVSDDGTEYSVELVDGSDTFSKDFGSVSFVVNGQTVKFDFLHESYFPVTLPERSVPLADAAWEETLDRTFRATGYEAQVVSDRLGVTVNVAIDFTDKIATSSVTDKKGEVIFNLLRAVTENKAWVYSDSSGAWLRAETDADPATYFDGLDELSGVKAAWETMSNGGDYDLAAAYDPTKEEYAVGDFFVTVRGGYVVSTRNKTTGVVTTFSKYGEVGLALPALGSYDEQKKAAFLEAIRRSDEAASFRQEFVLSDGTVGGMRYTTDVLKGTKSFTRMTAEMGEQSYPMMEGYREWADGSETIWTRTVAMTAMPSADPQWERWTSQTSGVTEAAHGQDLYFYHAATVLTGGGESAEMLFILSRYDAETDTYIIKDYNALTGKIVENRLQIANGYITKLISTNVDWLKALGMDTKELVIEYSAYNEASVTKPVGI